MTESKAIKIIKEKVCDSRCIPQLCNDGCMYENTKCAFSMAIQALEKQIAKKPVHDGCLDNKGIWHEWNGVNGRPYDLCPNCNTNLCCEMPYDNKPKYCKHCGQKLDWSDEE